MTRACRPLLFFCFFILAAGCDSADEMPRAPYPVLDSGVVSASPSAKVWWLDNHRVLFEGDLRDKDPARQGPDYHGPDKWMGIWDVESGKIEEFKSNVHDVECFDPLHGHITYYTSNDYANIDEIKVQVWSGTLGHEQKMVDPNTYNIDPFNCDFYRYDERQYPGELKGKKYVVPLLAGHGYLWPGDSLRIEIDKADVPKHTSFYDAQGKRVVELPFRVGGILGFDSQYYPFKQAYFLGGGGAMISGTHVGWWLYLNGKVEEVHIPSRIPLSYRGKDGYDSMRFHPTRAGVVFRWFTPDDVGGAYLAQEGRLLKVIDGAVDDSINISPDGCRAALSQDPDVKGFDQGKHRGKPPTIKMVDFCKPVPGTGKYVSLHPGYLLIDAQDLQTNIHAGAGIDIVQVIGNAGVTLNLAQAEVEVVSGGLANDVDVWKRAA